MPSVPGYPAQEGTGPRRAAIVGAIIAMAVLIVIALHASIVLTVVSIVIVAFMAYPRRTDYKRLVAVLKNNL